MSRSHPIASQSVRAGSLWATCMASRWAVPALVLLGMLLVMPSINAGLSMDDFLHWSVLTEGERIKVHPGSPWGLFHFLTGDVAQNQALKASGELMWWAADDLRTSFWRPLSEVTHWIDYRLWPRSPAVMHLHSVLWLGALIYLMARLYRQLDPGSPMRAHLAVLFFATSSLHLTAVAWIAARNQLVAACFMVACVGAFHLWRTRGSLRHRWLAIGLFLAALLSAEAGLATLGYLVAHALVYHAPEAAQRTAADRWRLRAADLMRALAPFLLITVLWRLAYTAMGYGSSGSGFYVDPADDPLRFAGLVLERLPALLMAQLVGVPSATLSVLPAPQQILYAGVAMTVVAAAWLVARAYGLWTLPLARFLGLGALLSLVPMCASEPTDRLLLSAEIGLCGLLAMLLMQVLAWHRLHRGWLATGAKVFIGVVMLVHLVIQPLQTLMMSTMRKHVTAPASYQDALSLPDASQDPYARVILLNPPVGSMAVYYPAVRRYHGVSNPRSIQALAHGMLGLSLHRIDARTLELRAPGGRSFMDGFSRDVRTRPFKVGERIRAGRMQAVVAALSAEGMPTAVRFQFDSPAGGPPWRFYVWSEAGYVPYALPAPGQSATLPAPDVAGIVWRRVRAGLHAGKAV